ncbi:MAG: hypothetical protein U9O20_01210 [Patescibacteria group bacterium]|nr:hypothetical protein [Patescibacteria group bacterium]
MKKIFEKYSNKKISVFAVILLFAWLNFSFAQDDELNNFEDRDDDGLADIEEETRGTDPDNPDTDGDGYGDGVEVDGGYDPLIPAPGDRVGEDEESEEIDKVNVTDIYKNIIEESKGKEIDILKEAFLTEEGVVSIDDEDGDVSLTDDDIEDFVAETLEESGLMNTEMEMIDEEDLNILDPSEDEDAKEVLSEEKKQVEEYLIEIGYILTENYDYVSGDQDVLTGDLMGLIMEIGLDIDEGDDSRVNEMKEDGKDIFEQLKEIEAPYVLKDVHVTAMSLFQHILKQDENLVFDRDDPVGLNLLIGQIEGVVMEADSLSEQVNEVLQQHDIDTINTGDYQGQVGAGSFF